MELPHLYVLILLLNMFDFSSGITYNKGDTESHFACDSKGIPQKDEMIKLYLSSDDLKIECFFQSEVEFTTKEFLSVFTSAGLAPSLEIINSTYTGIFHFNLTLYSDRVYWLIDIPRENITKNTDIATVEEWLVRITLQYGLNIYTTEGTLLDTVREPILHWKLGTMMNKRTIQRLYPHVVDLKMTKCPCANDVALLGFVMNTTFDGVYIGLSFSGFWDYDDTQWYNLTDMIYSQVGEEHKQLSVVDMVLTNHFLVILTSLGLFISGDLRYPSSSVLMLSRVDFCGFERVDYIKGKLWYNERCFANREHFEVDYVTITFDRNRTLSEANSCFYSKEPFLEWLPCLPPVPKGTKTILSTVITVLVDQEQSSAVYLFHNQKNTIVSVRILKHNKPDLIQKFPFFSFPSSFSSPVGMIFHPRSHFLYAYGNQVWLSIDGGNTFDLIADFHDDIIKNTYHSFYTSDITLVSQSGKVYLTKAGLEKYSNIGSISDKIFTLYYDHMGFIHKLTPDHFEAGGSLTAFGNSKGIFGQAFDMGFDTALAPQYLTLNEMIFYAYVPKNEPKDRVYTKRFYDIHFGKLIHSRKTGTAYITKVFQHNTPEGFLSSVIAELIDPFGTEEINESSCLSSSLSISEAGNYSYKLSLQLQTPGVISSFQDSDIEKTVVIPGYSSFLITTILDNENALAVATMPEIVPHNMTFQKDSWFLYNFGKRNGQTWNIYAKPCNYWFQQHDDSLSLSVLKYIDLGKSHTLKMKVIPNTKVLRLLEIPLLQVIVGNPNLLEVEVEGYFDESDSYIMEVSTASKTLHQRSGKFKQCANATTRKECNCTNDQKFSYAVAFSDCREKVPRFKFPVIQYPISLQVFSEDGNFPVETPYLVTVTEVNNRENWNLRHTVPENVKKMKNYLESILSAPVYNPLGLNLSIKGSELFHFRVSVVPGVSFCNLVEEFQIYVDEAPLPFPGHTLIAVAAAVLLGGLIFIAFMFQIRNIHPWDTFKKLIRRSNVNPTNTTAN
ncbi:cation channel sperm-associated auxiliary subunit beta isoform X2 [Odocoileus virginianus]|uniref:Cation channel sperm-associated auxiliary subunit beta isoform X2 n=1 Tax=Odocoileus virginianus TaxID=9874 RepID=A0A6J0W2X6_ODOVR